MRSLGGDLLAMIWQIAAVVAVPLIVGALVGNWLDERYGTAPWALLVSILAGLGLAGGGMFAVLRRYVEENPAGAVTDAAREAGRRWEREIEEEKREAGEQG